MTKTKNKTSPTKQIVVQEDEQTMTHLTGSKNDHVVVFYGFSQKEFDQLSNIQPVSSCEKRNSSVISFLKEIW